MSEKKEYLSNYEIAKYRTEKEFLTYDQEEILGKFPLSYDADYIYIDFLKHAYCIERKNGRVSYSLDGFATLVEADFNEAMTIYDVLCYSKKDAGLSGKFVKLTSLSSIQGSSAPVAEGHFLDAERFFDGKEGALAKACERLGGRKAGQGDVAYELPLFDFLPVRVQFWSSDEDFPANLQFFFDENVLQYLHFETLWYAVSHLIKRLKEEMTEW